jgi:hypothetical protein
MRDESQTPYLSVVVTGRSERLSTFIERWNQQANRHGLSSEVLPAEPRERNTAIRQARGEFILVTNTGALFSDELMQFLAVRRLEKRRVYRIDVHEGDNRVHAREGTFALTPDGFRRNGPHDIAAEDSDLHFGSGWFPAEHAAGAAPYRWMENHAEIVLRMPGGGRVIALEVEPGPGIAETPAILQVSDDAGTTVAEWQVNGRIRVELAVPPPPGGDLRRLRFEVRGGGLPVLDDPRILNLRFIRCDCVQREPARPASRPFSEILRENWPTLARLLTSLRAAEGTRAVLRRGAPAFRTAAHLLDARGADIFPAGEEFRFGHGWHPPETAAGERFRWASRNAQLLVRIERANYELGLLIEPGPGLEFRPFTLIVRDGLNSEIARASVNGLTWIQIPLRMPEGAVAKLFFTVDGDGVATVDDPRVLNFRVLVCGAVKPYAAADTPALDIHACWPDLRIDERAPEIDWLARLAPDRARIAAMGMPEFLHTNACADFLLMSRDDWRDLRGYPELAAPDERLEALLCYTAHFSGAGEEILAAPLRAYRGAGAAPQAPEVASCLSAEELQELIVQMRVLHGPVIYNAEWTVGDRAASGPYVSVVIAARNDNHGGNMLGRMQAFFDAWLGQAARYGLPSEIVVVEWNPPADRPRLIDAIEWPASMHPCEVRFLEVSPELHARFPHADAVPLHQMIAKNVGIRRARGEFVLATNLDIVLSAELMRFLAERRLERSRMYRLDRYDVSRDIPARAAVDELLAFCRNHCLRVFAGDGSFALDACGRRELEKDDIVTPDAGIRFGPGWYAPEQYDGERFRWIAAEAEVAFSQPATGQLIIDLDNGPSAGGAGVGIEVVSPTGAILGSGTVRGRCTLRVAISAGLAGGFKLRVLGGGVPLTGDLRMLNVRVFSLRWETADSSAPQVELVRTGPPKDWSRFVQSPSPFAPLMRDAAYLHTNACGDFTLLARDDWFALRGYPELPIWPMHIDALFCYEAHHAGVREVILPEPMQMFHIEHLAGAGWTPEGEEERRARVARKQVPAMEYDEFERWVHRMRRFNAPIIVTRGDWGLGGESLPETVKADLPK